MHVFEPAAGSLVGYTVLHPKALDQSQVLFEPSDAFAFRNAEGIVFNVAITQADTEDEVAPGDDVQRRHRLRDVDGIVQVEQQDAEPDRHLAGFRSQPRQERHRLKLLVVALVEVVLTREERVPPAIAREAYHRELVVQRAHHVGVEGLLVSDKEAEFHVTFLSARANSALDAGARS